MTMNTQARCLPNSRMNAPAPVNRDTAPVDGKSHAKEEAPETTEGDSVNNKTVTMEAPSSRVKASTEGEKPSKKTKKTKSESKSSESNSSNEANGETSTAPTATEAPQQVGAADDSAEAAAARAPQPPSPSKKSPKKTKKKKKSQSKDSSEVVPPSAPLVGEETAPARPVEQSGGTAASKTGNDSSSSDKSAEAALPPVVPASPKKAKKKKTAKKDATLTEGEVAAKSSAKEAAEADAPGESPTDEKPALGSLRVAEEGAEWAAATTAESEETEAAAASPKKNKEEEDARLAKEMESEEDEEVRLAMEMALAAAQHPHLSPLELQKLVGEKNKQAKIVEELARQKEEKLKEQQEKEREESARAWQARKEGWWAAAAKKAEEIKDQAERHLYADLIKKDREIIETRKKFKALKKVLKAHRLQGNRVETRHAFKRQRMEKKLMQTDAKLKKTQKLFTQSSYNVQEYLKAMLKASKKWRKKGTDDELMLEAQLCRNMHQMLALEKQKVKSKKETKEMKKYLQRCKGWLSDKKAFCEMNLMTLEATQHSMMLLYEDTLRRQDALIAKLKASEEFKDVDLSDVDLSHVKLPEFPWNHDPERSASSYAMRGLPIQDSIRVKKSHDGEKEEPKAALTSVTEGETAAQQKVLEEARSRQMLLEQYHAAKRKEAELAARPQPELYVDTGDECSVSSRLSDPDASFNRGEEESDSNYDFGHDAPWMAANDLDSVAESSDDDGDEKKPAAKNLKSAPKQPCTSDEPGEQQPAKKSTRDSPSTDSETPTPSESRESEELAATS